jgi:hypothetical protein
MADPLGDLVPYDVFYSGVVLDEFAALIARAKFHGNHRPLVDAATTIHHRLRVYPQFGEPIRDSIVESAQEWIAFAEPLVVHYVIYEVRRVVCVVSPMMPLPRSGY